MYTLTTPQQTQVAGACMADFEQCQSQGYYQSINININIVDSMIIVDSPMKGDRVDLFEI